ncbi:MAG: cell division protein FtsQ/DivIB [Rhodocyclaceae bacterium]|nr:cell division protein FtsQ/DivIB [Rhodocyclaceae bacterium]
MARAKNKARPVAAEPGGLWHQPALMNLLADILIVLSSAALIWAALTLLQRLPVFPLREIVVEAPPKRVTADQIEHAARASVVGNFFTVDLEAARLAFEGLPWVRKASLRRQWPDGLTVALEEHEAVARWRPLGGEPSGHELVNVHGEVFRAELAEGAANLPLLSGPEGSAAEVLRRHGEFSAQLATIGRRLDALALTPRRAWRMRLDDGLAIELGRDQEKHPLEARLARFVAHYDSAKARLPNAHKADMRYPNGFVLSAQEAASSRARQEGQDKKS